MQQERFTLLRRRRPIPPASLFLLGIAPLVAVSLLSTLIDGVWPLTLAAVVWFVVLMLGGLLRLQLQEDPYELRIDKGGIEFGSDGSTTRIPWKQVERISIVRTPTKTGPTRHLVAWLENGTTPPVGDSPELPRYDQTIGGVRICDINVWDATPAEIEWVLASYAGTAWKA